MTEAFADSRIGFIQATLVCGKMMGLEALRFATKQSKQEWCSVVRDPIRFHFDAVTSKGSIVTRMVCLLERALQVRRTEAVSLDEEDEGEKPFCGRKYESCRKVGQL
ncbi:hypothetical protein Tco_1043956 [Tanacetum coccineum]|uniref:Uncharacterized protein n=1 Tax=Tanacetum coccineum TaxID=301880 RepID=A0ABQ5GPT6_9ASTR